MNSYRNINYNVMLDTQHQYETIPELVSAVENSITRQFMVAQEDDVDVNSAENPSTQYVVSGKRSFEAAKGYHGKRVAVLNFANNHSIGGAPFSAGAQEESLCRCSTLLPCLQAMKDSFYERHIKLYAAGELDHMGNDDIIYTPDVIVFKTDERTDPIWPQMMPREDWYKAQTYGYREDGYFYGADKHEWALSAYWGSYGAPGMYMALVYNYGKLDHTYAGRGFEASLAYTTPQTDWTFMATYGYLHNEEKKLSRNDKSVLSSKLSGEIIYNLTANFQIYTELERRYESVFVDESENAALLGLIYNF